MRFDNIKKSSKYKGVSKITRVSDRNRGKCILGKFVARLDKRYSKDLGKKINLGIFKTEREAALARDKMILSLGLSEPLQILKPKIKL